MKVILPMAGRGSRFANEGYATPKPLIEVNGKPMLYWALKSLEKVNYKELVIILLEEHEVTFQVSQLVSEWLPNKNVHTVTISDVTDGQLCTVLEAEQYLTKEDVLVIASDTYIPTNIQKSIDEHTDAAGIISTFNLPGDRWSFAKTDGTKKVVKVAEKRRISDHCSTGLYYFSSGTTLLEFGKEMLSAEERTLGEYYVIPLYQKLIEMGQGVYICPESAMWDMGTPAAKAAFEKHLLQA